MNQDDIIRMAREQGLSEYMQGAVATFFQIGLEEGAQVEREAVCRIVTGLCVSDNNAEEINRAIRERGQK